MRKYNQDSSNNHDSDNHDYQNHKSDLRIKRLIISVILVLVSLLVCYLIWVFTSVDNRVQRLKDTTLGQVIFNENNRNLTADGLLDEDVGELLGQTIIFNAR